MEAGVEYMPTTADNKQSTDAAHMMPASESTAGKQQPPTARQNFELGIKRDYKVGACPLWPALAVLACRMAPVLGNGTAT